jgi:hypothetical protein
MADAIHGVTETGATEQDLITSVVQRELEFAAKLVPTIQNFSQFAVKGAKSVSIPKLDSFTAVNRASATAGDSTVLTSSADKLDLDQCPYIAYIVDMCDEIQSTLNWQLELAARAASAHGRFVDENLLALFETIDDSNFTPAATTRKDKILEAREYLLDNEAREDNLYYVVNSAFEKEILAEGDFVRPDAYGSARIPSGVIGTLYGVNVVIHRSASLSGKGFMYDSEAAAIAFQKGAMMSRQGANQYGSGAERVSIDQLFGSTGLGLGLKGAASTESPLMVKTA